MKWIWIMSGALALALVLAMAVSATPVQAAAISDCPVPPGAVNVALPSGLPSALSDALPDDIALPGEPFDTTDVYVMGHKHRRYLFVWNIGSRWIVAMEIGGIGIRAEVSTYELGKDGKTATLIENRFTIPVSACAAATKLAGRPQGMEIQKFDKMAQDDRAEYVSELISGAEKVLTDEGKPDLAAQVEHLFTTNAPDSNTSIGMNEFTITLAKARLADAQRALKNPDAKRVHVEDAMAVMLKKLHGIDLPQSFFTVNGNFKPKFPPK